MSINKDQFNRSGDEQIDIEHQMVNEIRKKGKLISARKKNINLHFIEFSFRLQIPKT